MEPTLHVVCPRCDGINRLPAARLREGGKCGRCHAPLFEAHPLTLTEANFSRQVGRSDIPLLVDFWAPWCAPCRMMAPVFEEAARRLEPDLRLAKVDTEEQQGLAMQYGIRSIPTLILFRQGSEVARNSGAMDLQSLIAWAGQHI